MFVMQAERCTFNANGGARSGGRRPAGRAASIASGAGTALLLLLLLLGAAPATGGEDQDEGAHHCDAEGALDPVLAGLVSRLGAGTASVILFRGLSSISEAQLWTLLESGTPAIRRGAPLDAAAATVLVLRLAQSGLFAEVDVEPGPAATALRLRLVEHPQISGATVHGLRESPPAALLAHFLGSPPAFESDEGRESTNTLRFQTWRKRMDNGAPRHGCQAAPVEPRWFARVEGGEVERGILRGGLAAARRRAVLWLRDRGFPYAAVTATLAPDGALTIDADEGRLVSFEVRGVPPSLRAEALRTLGFQAGDVFSSPALRRAAARLTSRFPFLELDTERAPDPDPRAAPAGPARTSRSFWDGAKSGRVDLGELYFSWAYEDGSERRGDAAGDRGAGSAGNAVELSGPGRIVLWLRTRRVTVEAQWTQLLRHTPATGFAPGLAATLHLWDAENRAHLALDGLFAANTKRAARPTAAGDDVWERLSAQEEVDWLAGARVAVPSWSLAELGAQVYALTDTNDTWRMSDLNSYVHSALLGLPDREYFRRAGATALATLHLFEQLTLGAELRRERFDALPNPHVWSLRSGEPTLPAAPVTAAELGSVLFRAEWSSAPVPLLRVGRLQRHRESFLSEHASEPASRFVTLATLELGNRALGSDPGIGYLHALSDSRLQLALGAGFLLRLRLRAGAGNGLPLQQEEALGGWSALRGYAFKELRGDASLLGNAEARWRWLGAFFDLGSVHQPDGWAGLRPGVGGQLFLEHVGSLEVAWRLDGQGSPVPSARALLGWDL